MEIFKRTWNSNHHYLGNGQKEALIYPGWKNWLDEDDKWKPIETKFIDEDEGFCVYDAPFTAKIPKLSTGEATFISDNLWEPILNKKIESPPLEMKIKAQGVNEVEGKLKMGDFGFGKLEYVVYEGAYANADLIYFIDKTPALRKIIRFNQNPNTPTDLKYKFNLSFSDGVEIWQDDQLKNNLKNKKQFEVYLENDDNRMIRFLSAYVWSEWNDKLEEKNNKLELKKSKEKIELEFDGTIFTKIIPKAYLDTASYPVYADATVSFEPSPGTADGYTIWGDISGQTWGTGRAAAATSFNNTDIYMICGIYSNAATDEWENFWRSIAVFDTSSLDDGTPINFATLNLSQTSAVNFFGRKIAVVSASTAVDAVVGVLDHAIAGFGSTHLTPDIEMTNGTQIIYLNSAGVAHINKTGYTKFGFLIDSDADNSEPTWASGFGTYVYLSTSEGSGIPLKVNYGSIVGQRLPMMGIG